MHPGEDSGSEASEEGGYSKVRLCFGLCGVLPSIIWVAALGYMIYDHRDSHCAEPDKIGLFMMLSVVGFGIIIIVEVIEGCYAGEPDFKMSPLELGTFCCQGLTAIFVYCWNYYGVIHLVEEKHCDDGLKFVGWVTLVGNNLVWFATLGTTIVAQAFHCSFAGADLALGDRL
mmetsp:Transcript_85774/g.237597  ORF Transcript_85774/g.237597 Transcript_85774/m.237597 type:complete len:172 (+) Transcript_85774:105-620(+)